MRKKRYIMAGWGLAFVAVACASLAFPAIAQKAASQRTNAVWQDKAAAFQSARHVELEARHAATLVDIHANADLQNGWMRDDFRIKPLSTVSVQTRKTANYEMQEFRCLAEAVYYEARSETRPGQLAVAEVIHNRVKSKHYPNTVCGVVYQGAERTTGCQFSFTCDGSTEKAPRGKAWKRSKDAAKASILSAHAPLTERATHYHTVEVNPHWAPNMRFEKQIGSHKFYSFKWRERPAVSSSSLSVAPPT